MRKGIFTLVLLTALLQVNSQSLREMIRGDRGISKKFIELSTDQQRTFSFSQLRSVLDLDKRSDFVSIDQQGDKLGFMHYRFYQTLKGIPIENSMYIAHVRNGKLSKLSGEIIIDFDESNDYSPVPALSSAQAIEFALSNVNAQVYMWQDAGMEQRIKDQMGNPQATYAPTATLVWFNDGDEISPRDLRLAYKVDVYAKQPLSRADYFIDAKNGSYLGKKDKLFYSDVTGTATTAYSGSQTIHSDLVSAGNYRLRDYSKGKGVITLHGETAQRGADYTSTSANWVLSGTNIAALDAHYGVSQTYSFYLAKFNRKSYNGKDSALYSYVNDPTYTDNAFWDGSAMNFNKRSNSTLNPGGVTGIDVTGHELTHGVTQTTSGLNYSNESGAMNESMSDIMGKSVQFYSKPADMSWLMSNDMNWIIRDMSNPNSHSQPDTYKGTYWYTGASDNGGVHTNSGVGNFMFYLLVTGGSGTNDIGNSYSVTGIGLDKADQILYRSETVYLFSTSKYLDWRTACINAATDLYGAGSNEVNQVQNAWYAVGIGTAGGSGSGCSTPTGLSSSSITNTSATVSWSPVSGAVTYNLQWKASTSSTWTTVNGLSTTSKSLTPLTAGTTYQFQVQTVCAAGTSGYSAAASFTTTGGAITYCASKGTSVTYEWIKQIIFGTINNTTGSNAGYGNFTNLSTNVTAGSTYTITFKPGYSGTAYREYWTVYIDYNQNGTLNNTGETVVQVSTTTTNGGTANITIPTTAKSGPTRMRIQMHYGGQITNPCSTFNYGEVEDYTINISGGTGITSSPLNGLQEVTTNKLPSIIVAPNPVASSNAQTIYRLADNGNTVMKVIDLDGRILKTIQLGSQTTGEHVYNLGLERIAAGNYILILEQNAKIVARNPFVIAR